MVDLATRLRYNVLRSPLAPAIKSVRRLRVRAGLKARERLLEQLGSSAETRSLGAELNRNGHVSLTDIVDPQLLKELGAAGRARLNGDGAPGQPLPRNVTRKAFWSRLLDSEMVDGKISAGSPFVRFALQPALLRVIAEAMGGLPQLDYVLLTLSKHVDAPLAQSQLWHRDHDDIRTIKVFVYLTDVNTIDDGPFTFLPRAVSERFRYSLRSHRGDARIFSRVDPSAKIEVIAPALSAFAVETSRCLHMGSRLAPGHERLLYTATYTSFPRLTSGAPAAFELVGTESDVERAVLLPESVRA